MLETSISQRILERLTQIEWWHGNAPSGVTKIMEEPELANLVRCELKWYGLCPPYPPQWDYWHLITETGGIVPVTAGSIRHAILEYLTP